MPAVPRSLTALLSAASTLYALAVLFLLALRLPLGSPGFFAVVAASTAAWLLALAAFARQPDPGRRALRTAVLVAIALRIPLAAAPVDASSDMVRYLWDGRVQTLGYNPYLVVPSDPALASTHTPESARMPSLRARTPYAPAAQLFFRLVVSLHDSTLAMKAALVACDLLTMLVLWWWLRLTGRPEWLVLVYAWSPLVVLEIAHSGHIDALGALWVMASLYWLTARRPLLATLALVLAVATKPLPIVLAPLLLGRIRVRDAALGAAVFALLYLQFTTAQALPLGAVPNVVEHLRFNGPLFAALAHLVTPTMAAATAVVAGLSVAAWCRLRLAADDPAAWAWPMAIALAGAPVIYPWYLLFFAPLLVTRDTRPLLAWSVTAFGAYVVWELSRRGGRWIVPPAVQVFEYGLPLVVCWLSWRRAAPMA